ncbi:hypothetical protein HK414_01580 [Ramlibacter terrae]|uniref:Uncharacterized protein n=1 Tax=Ramlibacter terrae TaxID=2732511 RepID=A0ABX6NZZ6_9BURK|nr:hypothetical protein HK414_01580 [Ramlibacter terrae]
MQPGDFGEQRAEFGTALRESGVRQRAVLPVPRIRHEVEAQRAVRIGWLVAEATEGRCVRARRALVVCRRNAQTLLVADAIAQLGEESRPDRLARGTPEAEAPPQVGATVHGVADGHAGKFGMARGEAQLQVEIILVHGQRRRWKFRFSKPQWCDMEGAGGTTS